MRLLRPAPRGAQQGRRLGVERFAAGFAAVAMAATLVSAVATAALRPGGAGGAAPASGHAQVVAQALLELGPGGYQWALAEIPVDADGVELVADAPTFLLADGGGAVLLTGRDGTRWRLSGGEAAYRYTGTTTNVTNVGATPAKLLSIALGAAAPDAGAAAVTPGAGYHDVDLVRDVLAAGETLTLRADVAAFVVVTSGTVTDAAGQPLAAGETAVGAGELAFTNDGEQTAAVVAAVIGPVVDHEALAGGIDSAADDDTDTTDAEADDAAGEPTGSADPPAPPEPTETSEAGGPTGSADPPAPSETTVATDGATSTSAGEPTESTGPDVASGPAPAPSDPGADDDGDGLTNGDEVDIHGTDPHAFDTDGDGYSDNAEINVYGSDPTKTDTDGDYLDDGVEIGTFHTDPTSSDSDGDGLDDLYEIVDFRTDPWVSDTDGDGLTDGDEVFVHATTPSLNDTDGDGVNDGDEIAAGTDPLNP